MGCSLPPSAARQLRGSLHTSFPLSLNSLPCEMLILWDDACHSLLVPGLVASDGRVWEGRIGSVFLPLGTHELMILSSAQTALPRWKFVCLFVFYLVNVLFKIFIYLYVNLKQARVTWEEATLTEKMPTSYCL